MASFDDLYSAHAAAGAGSDAKHGSHRRRPSVSTSASASAASQPRPDDIPVLFRCCLNHSWKIDKQLSVSFTWLVFIALLVMFLVAIINILVLGTQTKDTASDALGGQIKTNMLLSAREISAVVAQRLTRIKESVLALLASSAARSFQNDYGLFGRTSYFEYNSSVMPPNLRSDSRQGVDQVSLNFSSVYIKSATTGTIASLLSSNNRQFAVDRSVHLDQFWSVMYRENIEVVQVYFGTPSDILRLFPGQRVDKGFPDTYVPSQRSWYIAASAAARENNGLVGATIITDPYLDAFGKGWMVTMAKALYSSSLAASPFAVIGVDVTTNTIRDQVLAVSFLQTGYASLVQLRPGNSNGPLVVAHKKWNQNSYVGSVAPSLLSIEPQFPVAALATAPATGIVLEYTDSTAAQFVAYYPVLDKYAALVTVPENEAFVAVPALEDDIGDTQTAVLLITAAVLLVTLILTVLVVRLIAAAIARPLSEMVAIAEKITETSGDTARDLSGELEAMEALPNEDELGELVEAFTEMVQGISAKEKAKREPVQYPHNRFYNQQTPWLAYLNMVPKTVPGADVGIDVNPQQPPPPVVDDADALDALDMQFDSKSGANDQDLPPAYNNADAPPAYNAGAYDYGDDDDDAPPAY
jgi:HAMP domain-containing protein